MKEIESKDVHDDDDDDVNHRMYYRTQDRPPWSSGMLFAFQQLMVCSSSAMTAPLVVADQLCAGPIQRVQTVGTMLFISGIATFLQVTFGVRLSLLQGPSFAFLPPVAAFSRLYPCPNETDINFNETINDAWTSRICMVGGSLLLASLIQMVIGATGLIGVITKYIGPLTVAPLMLLLQIQTIGLCLDYAQGHWISIVLIVVLITTALYLNSVKVPIPHFTRRKKCHITWAPMFALFPYLIAILFTWGLCIILTATDVIPKGNPARTDTRTHILHEAPWFRIPYPGQWGGPKFHLGLFLGFVASTVASVIESVGDYYAIARVSNEPIPPTHAVNRGILSEGIGCFISGLFGGAIGLTTYSENIGCVGITKVASRITLQLCAGMLLFLGMFTKFSAIIGTLPDVLVGGILTISFTMVGGVGLSSIQMIDLRLTRNIAILGMSVSFGIMVPLYFRRFPLDSGIQQLDDTLSILLGIEMLVGGLVGFFLDNTVPGATRIQRGLPGASGKAAEDQAEDHENPYAFPEPLRKFVGKFSVLNRLPFIPMKKESD